MGASKKRKRPADHKKAPKSGPSEYRVTVRGMELVITEDAFDDWDLVEDLNDATGASMPSAVRRLLGPAQDAKVRAMFTDPKTRRVKGTAMADFVAEIFEALAGA